MYTPASLQLPYVVNSISSLPIPGLAQLNREKFLSEGTVQWVRPCFLFGHLKRWEQEIARAMTSMKTEKSRDKKIKEKQLKSGKKRANLA